MLVIRSIRCSNFKGLDAIDIHAPDSGCVLIEGPNEAGKTSLLDAVRFAITGLPPSGATAESLIQTGASQATVFVRLAGDLHSIEVERVISRSNPSRIRMVTVDGFARSTTESETEAMDCMERLLGLSAEDLSRACFISETTNWPGHASASEQLWYFDSASASSGSNHAIRRRFILNSLG